LQDKVQDIISGQLDDIDQKAVQDELRMLEEMAAAEEAAELPSPPTSKEQQRQKAAAEAAAAAAAAEPAAEPAAEAELEELPSVPQTKVSRAKLNKHVKESSAACMHCEVPLQACVP
jgi:hypothetical protein